MLRRKDVQARTKLSPSHINRLQHARCFPPYEPIAARVVGLPEHVLDAWLAERMAARASMPALGQRKPLPQWHFAPDQVPAYCGIRLLRRAEVEELTGLPHSTFYPRIPLGAFPAQIPLGEWAVRWVAHEVEAWVRASSLPAPALLPAERANDASRLSP